MWMSVLATRENHDEEEATEKLSVIPRMKTLAGLFFLVAALLLGTYPSPTSAQQTIFFMENFNDTNFGTRGWYDSAGAGGEIDASTHIPNSIASFHCHWTTGGTDCAGGTPHRHLFPASSTVYVSFWLKLGTQTVTWQGSGKPYHPHLIQLLTDADSSIVGPNSSLFSALIETSLFTPRVAEADSKAVNASFINQDLLNSTTPHAVAGCNGNQNASATCYPCPAPNYCNSTYWDAASPVFVNDRWHHVEFYAAMNSTSAGIANPDGIFTVWVDGNVVIDYRNVYLRTGDNPNRKFNQLLLAPYIGDGSPIAQDLWIDNLVVADKPNASPTGLPPPTNLRVVP